MKGGGYLMQGGGMGVIPHTGVCTALDLILSGVGFSDTEGVQVISNMGTACPVCGWGRQTQTTSFCHC